MNIQHQESETKGSFIFKLDGDVKAQLTYSRAGKKVIIVDHTQVSNELRGENVGRALVEHVVQYARDHDLKIIPLCPFTKSVIERDESLQDVLKK